MMVLELHKKNFTKESLNNNIFHLPDELSGEKTNWFFLLLLIWNEDEKNLESFRKGNNIEVEFFFTMKNK